MMNGYTIHIVMNRHDDLVMIHNTISIISIIHNLLDWFIMNHNLLYELLIMYPSSQLLSY